MLQLKPHVYCDLEKYDPERKLFRESSKDVLAARTRLSGYGDKYPASPFFICASSDNIFSGHFYAAYMTNYLHVSFGRIEDICIALIFEGLDQVIH